MYRLRVRVIRDEGLIKALLMCSFSSFYCRLAPKEYSFEEVFFLLCSYSFFLLSNIQTSVIALVSAMACFSSVICHSVS